MRSAAALAPSRARSAVSALRARAAAAERPRVPLCEAQAFLHMYAELASVAWTSLVALSLLRALYAPRDAPPPSARARRAASVAVGHGVPLALNAVPLALRQYGAGYPYCSIPATVAPRTWVVVWLCHTVPIWLGIAVNVFAYSVCRQ